MIEVWAVIFACLEPNMTECGQVHLPWYDDMKFEEMGECRDELPNLIRETQIDLGIYETYFGKQFKVMGNCQYVLSEGRK
jgi:hypothetical protein